jgi:integrase/recombinase XerD
VGKTTLKTESLTILLYSPYWRKWGAPHFRHSKAMHLLEAGINLIYIRDFLGHVNVTTTETYLRADTEKKRKALESVYMDVVTGDVPLWQEDTDILSWLEDFCR